MRFKLPILLCLWTLHIVCGSSLLFAKPKSNTVVIYWNQSEPFVYRANGQLTGVEYDIMLLFKSYLEEKYKSEFKFVFEEQNSFAEVFDALTKNKNSNLVGIDAFTITNERKKLISFSEAYLSNATIMISHSNIPIAKSEKDFRKIFDGKEAITIERTTYEKDLKLIRKKHKTNFNINYIPSKNNIIKTIEASSNSFGMIDLFVYLMYFQSNPTLPITRQDLFLFKRDGYAIGFPKKSNWYKEFQEFSKSKQLRSAVQNILPKYIDKNLLQLINHVDGDSKSLELSMLEKEKEIQNEHLKLREKTIALEKNYTLTLVAVAILFLILAGVLFLFYMRTKKTAKTLEQQNLQIDLQQKNISKQNILLEKKNDRLVGLNEEKNAIMRVLAHDLRAPLTSVKGLADIMLMDEDKLSEDQKKNLNFIIESAIRMNKMISNLLDTEAIEKGESKMVLENTELVTVLNFAIKSMNTIAKEKNIELKVTSKISRCIIKADYVMLMEVLENLLSNAIKFSYRNSHIDVKIESDASKVTLSVIDYGVGMTQEDVEVVFMKYQKLSSKPTENEKSIGLGLSITKQYVEQMNGSIRCESTPSVGTSFILSFPLTR